jgi:hypothetical protein
MNAKMPNRMTKAPAARAAAKPAAAVPARMQPVTAPASAKGRKAVTSSRTKSIPRASSVASPAAGVAAGKSKQARLISLLRAKAGATIDQMMTLTGWQAHTVRGTISGVLRKKLGLNVTCVAVADSGTSVYRIVGTAGGA